MEFDSMDKDKRIKELEKSNLDIEKRLKNTEYSLFTVHLRDVIKAFMDELKWSFALNASEYDKIKDELTIILKRMTDGENVQKKVAAEIILDIAVKCKNTKLKGNDDGHYINNIGFDEKNCLKILENYINVIKRNKVI